MHLKITAGGGPDDGVGDPWLRDLYERLHDARDDYERAVMARFGTRFGRADAEDFVSTALERVLTTSALPEPAFEAAWFQTVVMNVAVDEIRRQRGRSGGKVRGGALYDVVLLSELADRGYEPPDLDHRGDPERVLEEIDEPIIRAEAMARTREVLDQLDSEDVRLLLIRHVEQPEDGRARCASAAGLTVEAWRHRYKRAWERFVDAVAAAEPTPQCRGVRELVGDLDAGTLANGAAKAARARVDVHVLECTACRVFARDSYRILVLTPVAPAGCASAQRLIEHGSAFVSRNGDSIGAGGAAGGSVGLLALFGGSVGSSLKVLAVLCGVTVTTAGLCGGVIETIGYLNRPDKPKVAQAQPKPKRRPVVFRPTPTPTPTASPKPTPTSTPRPAKPKPTSTPAPAPASRKSEPPAAVASGSTGTEFSPVPVQSQSQPAPAPSGGSEFSP